jgi:peroxiredoxin
MDVQVLAISTDFTPTLAHWKKELNVSYPMLSDHMRKVSELYGILIPELGIANRVTFVVDTDGKIADIQEGRAALDPSGAEASCSRLKHK